MNEDYVPIPLPRELRKRRITVEVTEDERLILTARFHVNGPNKDYLYPTGIPFSDFSQTLTSFADLERAIFERFERDAIRSKAMLAPASLPSVHGNGNEPLEY